jgi:hypothetical protein
VATHRTTPLQALHPSGSTLVTTDRAGTLSSWQLLQLASPGAGTVSISSEAAVSTSAPLTPTAAAAAQECVLEVDDWQQHLGSFERSVLEVPELGGAALDGLAVLPGRVLTTLEQQLLPWQP